FRTTRAPVVRRQRTSRDRRSPFPMLIAVGVIVVGFILMRLIMNIQRIAPHQMVGVPQPATAQSPAPQAAPTQAPAASVAPVAPAPSRAPSPPPAAVAEAQPKKAAPPVATVAPSIALTEAFVTALANANAEAKESVASKEPQGSREEPMQPEDLEMASASEEDQTP